MRIWKQVFVLCAMLLVMAGGARADKIVVSDFSSSLVIQNLDGSGAALIAENQFSVTSFSLSPDERTVAFTRRAQSMAPGHLYMVGSDGLGLREVFVPGLDSILRVAWNSADGRLALAGSNAGGAMGVYTANADGSGLRMLRQLGANQANQKASS